MVRMGRSSRPIFLSWTAARWPTSDIRQARNVTTLVVDGQDLGPKKIPPLAKPGN